MRNGGGGRSSGFRPPARRLTTCSLTWMHRLFFLTAATPVVKVFLMLVARRRASCELPSSPAMEPDRTVAPLARPINRPLMFFLHIQQKKPVTRARRGGVHRYGVRPGSYFWESCSSVAAFWAAGLWRAWPSQP